MKPSQWGQISLTDSLAQDLDSIQVRPGIYMWKICPKRYDLGTSREAYMQRVKFLANVTQGVLPSITISHSVTIEGLAIKGRGLSQENLGALHNFLGQEPNRRWFRKYLDSLEMHLPAIYCGESGNLRLRLAQHLRGETSFGESVAQDPHLEWPDLAVHYCFLGPARTEQEPQEEGTPSRRRQAIEHLTTILSISPRVRRPG
jgi:hypothetical protein